MAFRAGLAMIAVATLAGPALAVDSNDGARAPITVALRSAPADAPAPEAASNAPASPLATNPVTPSLAAQATRGFFPMLHRAAVPQKSSPAERKAWLGLSLMAHGTAAFDAFSTRESISSGHGYERNPLMKPFAGSAAIYPATQALPFGFDYLSRRMMRSDHALLRHTWWLPQLAESAGSMWVGVRNLHVSQ
ncbi:MAG: hypothetical protein JO041_08230 [Acidobacteria bacterium]|nr:hypothetical protein [Acidobacteriota bacterium]